MDATIDAVEFRAGQRREWDSVARAWHNWQALTVGATRRVSERLVEKAGVRSGDRVLDVAAGIGEPALTAAGVVGREGKVVATDISPEMLAFARERALAAGIDNIEFLEADASSLDFRPASFDAALSRWGSSSSRKQRRPRRASAAFSSRERGWRSAPGARRNGYRCSPSR